MNQRAIAKSPGHPVPITRGKSSDRKDDGPAPRQCHRNGYTLIEMLVTVTIVAVLVALTTLGVRALRNSADSSKCMKNLRNLCVASVMAASENYGRFPAMKVFPWDANGYLADKATAGWNSSPKPLSIGEALGPYLSIDPAPTMDIDPALMPEVFQCPAARRNTNKSWINKFGCYRYNSYAIGRSPASSSAMIFIDTCWPDWPKEDFSHQNPAGLNVAYADGHVVFMDHESYMKVNPESNGEYQHEFFMQGWIE